MNFPRNLEEDEASQQLQEGDFSFNFSLQGQTVAVFYDRDFYVGLVLQVHNPDFADVTFMTSFGNDNIFKWPQSEDIDQVAAKCVFDSDSEVVPKNWTWQTDSVRWEFSWHVGTPSGNFLLISQIRSLGRSLQSI